MRKHARLVGLFLLYVGLQACTGGSACSGCVEPIPGGFPLEQRIANAAQARLTPNAITFLESNFSAIVATLMPDGLSFEIPESTTDVTGIGTVTICPGGGCTATINITGVDIQPTPPASLVLVAQLEVVTSNIRLLTEPNFTCLWLSGFECDMDIDTRRASPPNNTMRATMTITIDTRTGYADLAVTDAGLADDIQSDDISISAANTCGAIWCSIANIGFVKDIIIGQLSSTLTDTLTGQLSTFTCMACPDAPATCPSGTTCGTDSGFCEYSDGTCVGMLLGLEGRTDLGSMMASVSPGLSALVDFVFAAGGYANVDGNGLNLGAYGGLEAVEPNACVPADYVADWLTYAPAPIAPEFSSGNDFTTCRRCPTGSECSSGYTCADSGRCEDAGGTCESVTQPVMVKLGLAERFLNRAGAGLFESGMLCLGLGTSTVAQLNSGMLALLMPAIDRLTWGKTAPVSIEVRPQLPPRFLVGDRAADPLLGLEPDGRSLSVILDDAQLDFYLWMLDRWVKVLTVQMDLDVGVRLEAEAGQLVPGITGIAVQSSCMSCAAGEECPSPSTCDGTVCMNSDGSCEPVAHVEVTDAQIIGPPNNINDLFTDLLGLVAGMVPPFSPIALPEFSGFVLEIPDGGITSVSQGGENFLAIYANLAIAPPPSPHRSDTYARLTSLVLPADDLAARAPVRLREILPVATIDVAAHSDVVSASKFDYRWRVDEGSWSAWTRATRLTVSDPRLAFAGEHAVEIQSRLADDDSTIDPTPVRVPVHVEDVRPYIRTVHRSPGSDHPSEALRGRPETTPSSSGCGCAVPGRGPSSTGLAGLLGLALGAVLALRRRRRALLVLGAAALLAVGLGGGCDCGSGNGGNEAGTEVPGACTDESCSPGGCCVSSGACVDLPAEEGFCEPGFGCLDADGNFTPTWDPDTCTWSDACCAELPELSVGFVGQYSEVAVTPGGTIYVSAYSAGLGERSEYGDLVVGTWDATAGEMDWEHVDGVPSTGDVTGSPSGWRGGISTPGDDVGKYTTIAVGADGEPRVAYYDVTHGALKWALHSASGWSVRSGPIDDQGDAGRFADMAIGPDGTAAISYNAIEERTDIPGAYVSKIKVARGSDASGSLWTIDEVESMDIPCWADLCGEDLVCLASTRTCATPAPDDDCGATGCGTGQACVAAVCEDLFESPIDFPEGVGIVTGIDFAPDGSPVVVYYDRGAWDRAAGEVRPHGDLKQAALVSGAWTVTVLDGAGGDSGWYPSIDIDAAGQRHLSFVDGIAETLVYLNPDTGVREIVDGRTVAGRERNIVGDDSTIRVTASGEIWIAYQDATARTLLLAHRTAPGTWEVRSVDTEDSTGFFANMTLGTDGVTPVLSTYWHRTAVSGTTTTRYSYSGGARVFEVTP